MKDCAYCVESIQEAALVCRHCGREQPATMDGVDPFVPRLKWVLAALAIIASSAMSFLVWGPEVTQQQATAGLLAIACGTLGTLVLLWACGLRLVRLRAISPPSSPSPPPHDLRPFRSSCRLP